MADPIEERCALIIPSAVSVLCWLESQSDQPCSQDVVESLIGRMPAMTLPVFLVSQINAARPFADIDFEEAWVQWSYLRGKINEQGVSMGSALPNPIDQLASDLEILRRVLGESGIADQETIDHQVGVLDNYAKDFLGGLGCARC